MNAKSKFIWILPLLLLCTTNPVNAQSLEDVFSAVVHLEQKEIHMLEIDGEQYEVWLKKPAVQAPEPHYKSKYGTAFFVVTSKHLFLVTAEHIAQVMTPSASTTIRDKSDRPYTISLQELWNKNEPLGWIFHEEADIAVLPLYPSRQIIDKLKGHFLKLDNINRDIKVPDRTMALTLVGFPLGLGVESYFSPISLDVKTSSGLLRMRRFDNNKLATFFLLDKAAAGGYSGAPIFKLPVTHIAPGITSRSFNFKCLGLVHGTISDKTGGKFAAVVPAAYIVETIEKYENRNR